MRIVRFERGGRPALGVRSGETVVDLAAAAPGLPSDVGTLLAQGPAALEAAASAARSAPSSAHLDVASLRLLPPTSVPSKILMLGVNFVDHAAEGGEKKPEHPVLFLRAPSSLVGHGQPLVRPRCSEHLDFEGELAVLIGRRARHVPASEALSVVAGYSVFNDGSIRDYQLRTSQWTQGKCFDGTGGFGPEFVTADEVSPGATGLRLQTRLNGQVMQDANTADMIFTVADAIAYFSECMTLEPGDVFSMGTPAGVGFLRNPPVLMKPGDVCEVEIESIGVLRNPIVQEAP